MRQRIVTLAVLLAGLAAWLLLRPAERRGPDTPTASSPSAESPRAETGLAAPPVVVVEPVTFVAPPAPRLDARRLRFVGVGPPDRPAPDTAFEAWTFLSGESGTPRRVAAELRRTAPNEAWFEVSPDVPMVWFRASADRGRLVSLDGSYVEMHHAGPDPEVVRVPLFAAGALEIRVVDGEGKALAGAQVVDSYDADRGATTDDRGVTTIHGVVGDVFVHAVAARHAPSARTHASVPPGAHVERTLSCGPSRVVTGRAVDGHGLPLAGSISTLGQRTALDADGSFRFAALPIAAGPETYLVLLAFDANGTASTSVPDDDSSTGGVSDLGVVRFVSRRRVPIRFVSPRGDSLAWVTFNLTMARPMSDTRGLVIADPTYVELEDGEYRIAAKPFTIRPPVTLNVDGAWKGPPATVVLEDAFVLRGRCVYRGEGLPNWSMVMLRARAAERADDIVARLDAEGRFAVALPEAMRGAKLEIETPYATLVSGLSAPADGAELVVDLPAEQALTLVVRAVDAGDRPLSFRTARFERVPSRTSLPEGWSGGPSADGEASFWPVPKGSYRAIVDLWDGTEAASDAVTLERDRQIVTVRFER